MISYLLPILATKMSYNSHFNTQSFLIKVLLHVPLIKYCKCRLTAALQLQDAQLSGSVCSGESLHLGRQPESFVRAAITL